MCKGRPEGAIWIKLLQRNTRCYTLFYGFRTTTAISHRVNSKNINQRRNIRTWKWQNSQVGEVYLRLKFGCAAGLPALLTLLLGPDTPPPSPHTITVVAILTPWFSSVCQNNNPAHSTLCTHLWMCGVSACEWLDRHWITGARLAPAPDPGLGIWPVPGLPRRDSPLWGAREQRRSPSRLRRHPDEPSAMRWTLGSRLCVSLSSLTLTKPKSLTAKSPPWLLAASVFLSSSPVSQVAPV